MSDPLPIVVYSDVICPWCYVGKRRLEAALASPGMPAQVNFSWRPFELNPDMPAEGIERKVYRARKFGEARSAELDVRMAETGREVGIEFAFERMQRTPNTRLAHRLIWEAERGRAPKTPSSTACSAPISWKGSISAPPRSWKASPPRPGSRPTG